MTAKTDTPVTEGLQQKTRLGPHYVPSIECERCGSEHHIIRAIGDFQGRCSECSGFLRRPTESEEQKYYDWMEWKAQYAEEAK